MNIQKFLDNFQLIASTPSGIARLKSLILTIAIQGKLIKQDLKDKSSFEQIQLAKETKLKLIKENKIKSEKPLSRISQDEVGYDVPSNWAIARIGEILTVVRGASPRPKGDPRYFSKDRTKYHWVKISDINKYSDGWLLQDTDEFLTEEGSKHSVVLEKGTLVLTNSATVGVPVVLGFEGGCIHDGYLAFPFLNQKVILQKFLYYYFLYFRRELEARAYGMAQVNINTKIVRAAPITLPPIEEQKRIVAKVEELIAICDQLEAQRMHLEEIQHKATREFLAKIVGALTKENSLKNWQILQNNFSNLFVTSEAISSLKQAIVQLGVEGKLGTQVDAEESIQDLLIKLEREYVEKFRAKNADKRRSVKAITEGEIRFTYPSYWQIVRLGQLVLSSESGWRQKNSGKLLH
jgi:type I restriction enzyme S subunit